MGIGAAAGSVIGPSAAARLMETTSPWVPMLIPMTVLTPLLYLITVFIPETLPRRVHESPTHSMSIAAHLVHAWARLRESVSVFRSPSVVLLLAPFLLQSAVDTAHGQMLAQSISSRFGWSLAQTGYLVSARGLLVIAVMTLLPVATGLLTSGRSPLRWRLSMFRKDLVLAQFSLVCLVVGGFLMGGGSIADIVWGVVVSTLAVGLSAAAKALVASYVDVAQTSRMYVLTSMVENVGAMIAGPTMAWAFQAGMQLGGGWVGLPFFYLAVLSVLTLAALCFVRDQEIKSVGGDESGGESSDE